MSNLRDAVRVTINHEGHQVEITRPFSLDTEHGSTVAIHTAQAACDALLASLVADCWELEGP